MCARATIWSEFQIRPWVLASQQCMRRVSLRTFQKPLTCLRNPRRQPTHPANFRDLITYGNMASNAAAAPSLPPDLFDTTTLVSLASTVIILAVAYGTSKKVLSPTTPGSYRFLFIWHLFDAGIHFFLEGSFLYHVCPSLPIPLLLHKRARKQFVLILSMNPEKHKLIRDHLLSAL